MFGFLIETPEQRLDRLTQLGTVRVDDTGSYFWCAMCKTYQPTIDFVPHHGWFEFVTDFMSGHHSECFRAAS